MKIRQGIALLLAVGAMACSRQETRQNATAAKEGAKRTVNRVAGAFDVNAPYDNNKDDAAAREKERFDAHWRELQSFKAQQAAQQAAANPQPASAAAAPPPAGFQFVTGRKETFKGATAASINAAPVNAPITGDVRGPSVLRAQVYLDRLHFSVGAIDGRWGRNSAITVWWYQRARGIETTGDLDGKTYQLLAGEAAYAPVVKTYQVTDADLKGPFVSLPADVYEKAKLDCLCYESAKEALAEKFHADQDFLDTLNPGLDWGALQSGTAIVVPNVREALTSDQPDIASVAISIAGNSWNGFDAAGRILFHAPTTLGSGYDPSPHETVKVVKIVPMPHFHYDPTLFHEVPDSDPDANLAPGPNSPVGVVWMALSKPHYGMHGTPDPESIGYASSHGCVRLTNWDANEASHRLHDGVLVSFVDTRSEGMPEVAKKK